MREDLGSKIRPVLQRNKNWISALSKVPQEVFLCLFLQQTSVEEFLKENVTLIIFCLYKEGKQTEFLFREDYSILRFHL